MTIGTDSNVFFFRIRTYVKRDIANQSKGIQLQEETMETYELLAYDKDADVYETIARDTDAINLVKFAECLNKSGIDLSRKGEPVDWLAIAIDGDKILGTFTGENNSLELTEAGKRDMLFRDNLNGHRHLTMELESGLVCVDINPNEEIPEAGLSFRPAGTYDLMDIALVKPGNERDGGEKSDLVVFNFNDPFVESETNKTILYRDDIVQAFDLESEEEEMDR